MSTATYSRFIAISIILLALAAEAVLVPHVSQSPVFLGHYSFRAFLAIVGIALVAAVAASAALKWPKVAQGLSLSAATVVVMVALIEGIARGVLQEHPTPHRFQSDPVLSHKWMPGYESTEKWFSQAPEYTMAISSQGLRNGLVEIPKKEDIFRVLALGDSVTEGPGVALDNTFVKLVEQSLQSEFPQERIEIINAGIDGYGVEQEYLWLRKYGLGFQPDLVLLTVCLNDPSPFKPPSTLYSLLRGVQDFLHNHSVTYFYFGDAALKQRMNATIEDSRNVDWRVQWSKRSWVNDEKALTELILMSAEQNGWGLAWDDSALSYFHSWLSQIVYLARVENVQLLLAIIPVDVQVYTETQTSLGLDKPQRWLADFVEIEQLPMVDVLSALQFHRDQVLFYDHLHLSASGHAIVAEKLHDSLRRLVVTALP